MLPVNNRAMAWFFHVIEQHDGQWACRHGRQEYDTHPLLDQAIEHISAIASLQRPAQIYVHRLDGNVESLGLV
jgi:hypothetical protein